jgi:hypothetical protein
MSILRRYHQQSNVYFITNVTYERKPVLNEQTALPFHQNSKDDNSTGNAQ